MRANVNNVVASAIGLVALIGMVSVAAAFYAQGQDFWTWTIVGNAIAVPTAIAAWSGALWKGAQDGAQFSLTWKGWIGMFFPAALLAGLFIAIDVAVVHPGMTLAYTIAAVALSFVALPSALRAWIMQRLSNRQRAPDE